MCSTVLALLSSLELSCIQLIQLVTELSQENDLLFGEGYASIVRQKLQEMEGEIDAPCSSFVKSQCKCKSMYMYVHVLTLIQTVHERESKQGSDSVVCITDYDLSWKDQKEGDNFVNL